MRTLFLIAIVGGGWYLWRKHSASGCQCAGCAGGTEVPIEDDGVEPDGPYSGYLGSAAELVGGQVVSLFSGPSAATSSPSSPTSGGCSCGG